MSKDGPKQGRMGFGYHQAKAAGAPYVRPRVSSAMNAELRELQFAAALRATLQKFPNFSDLVENAIKGGQSAEDVFTAIWPDWRTWDENDP